MLASELPPTTRAKVHRVADLMLEIYSTLVDMQYLEPEAIRKGPHKINITLSREQEIDDSVIYLWQILPYLNLAYAEASGFIFGGTFVDFRDDGDILSSRDPMYAIAYDNQEGCGLDCEVDENGELNLPYMRPTMTTLTNLGNHQCAMIYDVKTDRIWITDQLGDGTCDPALKDVPVGPKFNNNRNDFTHEPSRPAAEVLKDIVKWYRDLLEIPGGDGDYGVSEWDHDILKDFYEKNGWPDNFDAHTFKIDLARYKAKEVAKRHADMPRELVEQLLEWQQGYGKESLEKATLMMDLTITVDGIWTAKLEHWQAQQTQRRNAKQLEDAHAMFDLLCPQNDCQRPATILALEIEQLRSELEHTIADRYARPIRRARQAKILNNAWKAAEADVTADIPDARLWDGVWRINVPFYADAQYCRDELDCRMRDIKAVQDWLGQVPDDAHMARELVRYQLDEMYHHDWYESMRPRRYLSFQMREWLDPLKRYGVCSVA
ncbi:hypothetical protein HII31_12935 [Pseudocercospora fuligena]|uniref:Uncharacterized protein n=1 Tax=Pseudocercospora fuligena TaxID=685502 RepID=A0A8H6R799_9PEZI|nr:hypothetical protein HII31_12935 [Pseudocercospora fuligena]